MSDDPKIPESDPRDDSKHKEPRYTVVLIGEDGHYYKLNFGDWCRPEYIIGQMPEKPGEPKASPPPGVSQDQMEANAIAAGAVAECEELGSYLAFLPLDMVVGVGYACTVVNLKSILEGHPKKGGG